MLGLGRRIAVTFALVGLVVVSGCDSGGSSGSNQSPAVSISSPEAGASFASDETISFAGSADDPEDGTLTGDALVWTSSADGEFGSGEQVTTSSLSSTQHIITLTATDSDDETGQDTISITVRDESPTANISNPSDHSAIDQESTAEFEGSGMEANGGELSGEDLEWSSNVDGSLGTGKSLSVVDLSQGPHSITLTATDDMGRSASDSVRIVVESPGFDIRVRFLDDFTSGQETAIRNALEPWSTAITGDLPPSFPEPDLADNCDLVDGRGIDDLAVVVGKEDLDGEGGVLAQAGPCAVRVDTENNFRTSISGTIQVDEADVDNPQLEQIVTHEIGHALGIGIEPIQGWGSNVSNLDTQDPFHAGSNTTSAFDDMGGEAYLSMGVPIANTGGRGTRGGHWREENFNTELMTGFINPGVENPLSRVTLASLADIGYEVDQSAADSYSLPMPQEALWLAEADATLSRDRLASENFGAPSGSALGSAVVAGTNADSLWSESAPEEEVFSGLVQFGVPSSLPPGVSVEGAEIRLTVDDRRADTTDHDVGIYTVSEGWSEEMVTWDSKPAVEDSPVTTFEHRSCNNCREDVTGLATDWVAGDTPNYGVELRAPDASSNPTFSVGFVTRHSSNSSSRPHVVVQASMNEMALHPRSTRSSREKVSLENDIRNGMLYGVDPDGRVLQSKRLR